MDISEIDKNFAVESNIDCTGLKIYNGENAPFKIYGVKKENDYFLRMPDDIAKTVSEGVSLLNRHTSGGRIRFMTDSKEIAVIVKKDGTKRIGVNQSLYGSGGLDIYANINGEERYVNTVKPTMKDFVTISLRCPLIGTGMRTVTVNFPLYDVVKEIYIGLPENAVIREAPEYKISTPIVYYGSSITQGGCASLPGTCYQSIISRDLDADFVNLGFSGNARGEDEIAEYIAGLKMSCFVYDYDHNSPSEEHLQNTHEKMFKTIRNKNPELPVIMVTRPKYYLSESEIVRNKIIRATYENAVASGDRNVYFIDGRDFFDKTTRNICTVDGCHPNDVGFYKMAILIEEYLKKALNIR